MGGRYNRQWYGWVVAAAALALAAAGGSAVGLGAPTWLAGTVGAVSALVAAVAVDRVFRARDERAAARERRSEVLDVLTAAAPGDQDDALGLLRADRSPAPFRGRGRELRLLADWCAEDSANPVFMITGSAGVGKSRLALKFASTLIEGWARGWLRAEAGEEAISAVRACGDPAMILVDDADGRADLVPLLDALARQYLARQYTSPAIRVILLARSVAGLVASLASQLDDRHEWIVTRAPVLDLQPEGGPEDRERWFAEAVTAFAAERKVAVPALPPHAGRLDVNQPILVLQAQALLAILGTVAEDNPRKLSFEQVADALMKHEKRRWAATAATWNWAIGDRPSEALQERSIAALVLLGPDGDDEAKQILRRIRELHDAQEERLDAIAAWISSLYVPDTGGAPRIRPDLIGEWFVVSVLTAHPAFARSLRDGLTDRQAARALSLLASAADRIESASSMFGEFASGNLRRRILAAAYAAMTGQAGRQLLDAVIAAQIRSADDWTIDDLTDLDRLIPNHVLLLTHVAIADISVQLWRDEPVGNPAVHEAGLARALGNLAVALDRVGRYQDALAAHEEAITFYRALAKDNPAAHQAGLAGALGNLAAALGRVGRYQDALAVNEEAITFYRALAKENPAAHQAGLAVTLDNLAITLGRVGRYQDGLAVNEEAVTFYRALAKDNPAVHQADLARVLDHRGVALDQVGRYQDALAVNEEAITFYRALAKDNPAVHQADLAKALDNLDTRLDRVGRHQDALAVNEEAITFYRALAKENPAVHQADLARALDNLGTALDRVGRHQEALAAREEAVTFYRALAKDNPAVHQAGLAAALDNLGTALVRVGRYQDALAAHEEAATFYRTLAKDNPAVAVYQAGLAGALSNLSAALGRVGRYQDTLAASEEAVTFYRTLAKNNPAVHQIGLTRSLGNLAVALDQVGRHQDALRARTEATDILRELASGDRDLYQGLYQQSLGELRREYDRRGMHSDAIFHHLVDPADQPPSPPAST